MILTLNSRSYEARDRDYLSTHHLPVQKQRAPSARPRSPSRTRQPYTSNCGRRRWPPSPKVEEVKNEEEIPMRGVLDQKPMLIEAAKSASSDIDSDDSDSSDDSSEEDETPPASDSSRSDHTYSSKSKQTTSQSQLYNMTQGARPSAQRPTPEKQNRMRGRSAMPKIDTELARSKSRAEPLPQLERARSPYASGPQDRKPNLDRFSGEYLLSPDVMTPRKQYAPSPRSHSQYQTREDDDHRKDRSGHDIEKVERPIRPALEKQRAQSHYVPRSIESEHDRSNNSGLHSARPPVRPPMDRRASELPYAHSSSTSTPTRHAQQYDSPSHPVRPPLDRRSSDKHYPSPPQSARGYRTRSRHPQGYSDDSDGDHAKTRGSSGKSTPLTPATPSATTPAYGRYHERRFSSELPLSPTHRSSLSSNTQGPPVNLSSLVSGAAIAHTLNSMMDGERTGNRRASPRPSPLATPNGSPKSSPYSSPPRTPPNELSQRAANPITGLKNDSPKSRPSSPLSSRSTLWTAEADPSLDHESAIQPPPLKSRRTAPLPSPRVEESGNPSLLATPGIVVRSPSPAQASKGPADKPGAPRQFQENPEITTPKDNSHSSNSTPIRPGGFAGRPRAASSADVRPQLSVEPPPFLRSTNAAGQPRSTSRARSPSLVSPNDKYKVPHLVSAPIADRSTPLHPEMTNNPVQRSRSRSYVPEQYQAVDPTHASSHAPATPTARSRSSMSYPAPVSEPKPGSSAPQATALGTPAAPLTNLPICPRPHSVAGLNDWYTLRHNDAFAICPDCRHNVFGSGADQYLQPRPVSSSRKTLCDLNNPWVRLACLLRGPDVNLLSALSEVTSKERSCPQDREAPRDWYRLEDPDHNGKHIVGFNACPHCVHSLETLFPVWRKVFYRPRSSSHHDLKERFCGLRNSALRFGDYLDMIVDSARQADSKYKPLVAKPVIDLAKQMATIEDCPRDAMFPRKAWHIHPHLPEFTICQECYEDVVYPLAKTGYALAAKIDKKPQQFSDPTLEICCHLYSPRMRKVFREACEDDDYEHLKHTVLKRHMLQRDLLDTFKEQQKDPDDEEVGERLRDLLKKWKDKE